MYIEILLDKKIKKYSEHRNVLEKDAKKILDIRSLDFEEIKEWCATHCTTLRLENGFKQNHTAAFGFLFWK